jgi:8-oxo-dGTP pyrophosphatase MutT (NUDIX family)
MAEAAEPVLRHAARAVVLDGDDRVLLVRFRAEGSVWWAAPGGGLEEGETHEAAILRELAEETGVRAPQIGPCVWTREHVFPWKGRVLRQRERYFVVRVESPELRPELSKAILVEEGMDEIRWWTLEEIERSAAVFTPTRLATLLRDLLTHGPPPDPLDAGV